MELLKEKKKILNIRRTKAVSASKAVELARMHYGINVVSNMYYLILTETYYNGRSPGNPAIRNT